MQTQKTTGGNASGTGNLKYRCVLVSFQRRAYRIISGNRWKYGRKLFEDTGKSMVLQKVVQMHKGQLPYLGGQMKRPGMS